GNFPRLLLRQGPPTERGRSACVGWSESHSRAREAAHLSTHLQVSGRLSRLVASRHPRLPAPRGTDPIPGVHPWRTLNRRDHLPCPSRRPPRLLVRGGACQR